MSPAKWFVIIQFDNIHSFKFKCLVYIIFICRNSDEKTIHRFLFLAPFLLVFDRLILFDGRNFILERKKIRFWKNDIYMKNVSIEDLLLKYTSSIHLIVFYTVAELIHIYIHKLIKFNQWWCQLNCELQSFSERKKKLWKKKHLYLWNFSYDLGFRFRFASIWWCLTTHLNSCFMPTSKDKIHLNYYIWLTRNMHT